LLLGCQEPENPDRDKKFFLRKIAFDEAQGTFSLTVGK
jgi:hypothetical protein